MIVNYKNEYYLFSTNQCQGYWWSRDLLELEFYLPEIPGPGMAGCTTALRAGRGYHRRYHAGIWFHLPAASPIWMSTNPKANEWKPWWTLFFHSAAGDPAFFTDEDGRLRV